METSQRAKCSRTPSPRGFHGDGGGALAGLRQQMWPVQGWRGAVGGAAPGSTALGRGRPAAGFANKPGAVGLPPPGGLPDSSGTRTGCSRLTFCSPPAPSQPGPGPPGGRPCLLSDGLPAWELGTDSSPHGSSPPAGDPAPHDVCPLWSLDSAASPLPHPKPGPPRAGSLTSLRGALENHVGAGPPTR